MKKYLKYLRQPSTIKGTILIAGIWGYNISPEMQNQIVVMCGILYGLINVARNEDKEK